MNHVTPEMQECIENCQNCHAICLSMASTHCLELGGAHIEPNHFRLMLDCAQICATAADFMLRGSKHHVHICRECAEICNECALSCGQLSGMEACVKACHTCATSCRNMAGTIAQ